MEASANIGGAAVTDEFLPGFRNSAASYTVSLLQPKVIRDMQLERHGLKVVLRKTDNFLPGDGDLDETYVRLLLGVSVPKRIAGAEAEVVPVIGY